MRKRGHPGYEPEYRENSSARRLHNVNRKSDDSHSSNGYTFSADHAPYRISRRSMALEDWQRLRGSRWDEKPKGWESVTIMALKLCNMLHGDMDFSGPPPRKVVDLCSIPALTANNSHLMSTVVVQNGDPSTYLAKLFEETLGESNVRLGVRLVAGQHVVTLPSPKHAAYFLALPAEFQLKRFPGTVTTSSGSVFSSTKTSVIHGLQPTDTLETAREKFPTMTRNPILIQNLTKSTTCEAAFALFEGELPENAEPLFSEINDQSPDITQSTKADRYGTVVQHSLSESGTFRSVSNVLLILNAVKTFEVHENVLQSISSKCSEYGHVEYTRVSKNVDYLPRVIVKFSTNAECSLALKSLGGRTFCGRVLVTTYGTQSAADQDLY